MSTARALFFAGALLAGIASCSAPALADAPGSPAVQRASDLFDAATNDWDHGRPHKALQEFRESYAAVPAAATLWNIVAVERDIGTLAAAYRDLLRYLAQFGGAVPTARLREALELKKELEDDLACVRVTVSPAGVKVLVDDQPVENLDAIWLDPGLHVVRGEAPERRPVQVTVPVEAKERLRVELDLPEASAVNRVQRKSGIAVLGVGLAGLVAGGVLAALALDRNLHCPASSTGIPTCQKEDQVSAYKEGATLAFAANFPLVVGAVLTGVGLHLTLTSTQTNQTLVVRSIAVRAGPTPGGAAFGLTGTF
jgi:hypothetical protein